MPAHQRSNDESTNSRGRHSCWRGGRARRGGWPRPHVCMHTCMYAYVHVCIHACMHVCMYACMHACTHVCMRSNIEAEEAAANGGGVEGDIGGGGEEGGIGGAGGEGGGENGGGSDNQSGSSNDHLGVGWKDVAGMDLGEGFEWEMPAEWLAGPSPPPLPPPSYPPPVLPLPPPPPYTLLPLPPPPPFELIDGPVNWFFTGGGWLLLDHTDVLARAAVSEERERLRRVRLHMQPYGHVLDSPCPWCRDWRNDD